MTLLLRILKYCNLCDADEEQLVFTSNDPNVIDAENWLPNTSVNKLTPKKATKGSIGLDLYIPIDYSIEARQHAVIDTGIKVDVNRILTTTGYFPLILGRSSLAAQGVLVHPGGNTHTHTYTLIACCSCGL